MQSVKDSRTPAAPRGMTFIEAIIGIAIMLVVFLAIFGAFELSIELVFTTKAKTGAVALVNEKMEYIRGLSYDAIGTSGGIPSGSLPQTETATLNSVTYTLKTLVVYRDDPADGSGDADPIQADYKLVRVEADWSALNAEHSTFAETYIAPRGLETLGSGGTLRIYVTDAQANPLAGATVHVTNSETSPAVDVSVDSDSEGQALFPGAPSASGYHIEVTKSGDSSDETYPVSAENPNPDPGDLSVVNGKTTSQTFAIDALGSMAVSTFSPASPGAFTDTFNDESKLSATSSATVSGGSLRLSGSAGSYPAGGSAYSIPVVPVSLQNWNSLSWSASTSPDASVALHLYYWNGTAYELIPDSALPGNSEGLVSPLDLSTLSPSAYPNLEIRSELASDNPDWTPEIFDWSLAYTAGPTPLPNVAFSMHGAKTIGTAEGGAPIYKFDTDATTDSSGVMRFDPLEWDAYTLSLPTGSPYAIAEECPSAISVSPGAATPVSLTLQSASANTLRVVVTGNGNPVPGASVALQGIGSAQSSSCGQVFFGGLAAGTYTLTVSAPGYQNFSDPSVEIAGGVVYAAPLSP